MQPLRFSILMCVKDGEKYLKEQIESIINQDFTYWELLIVDDCSIDNSFKILKTFAKDEKRIKLIKNQKNLGILRSFIINVKKQKGEWIVFCDQDDIWIENKLSTLNRFINEKSSFNLFLHNGAYLVDKNEKKMRGAFGDFITNNQTVYSEKPYLNFLNLFFHNKVIGCFSCVNNNFIRKYLINLPLSNIYHDHWIAILVSLYSRIYFIDLELIKYRRHQKNNTLRNKLVKKIIERFLLITSLLINHINIIFNSFKDLE